MTDAERARRIEELFHGAADVPPGERCAWLDARCDDADVRSGVRDEVDALLAADAEAELDATLSPSGEAFADALGAAGDDPWVGRSLGAWTLGEPLGEGGMGRVYRARRSTGGFEQEAAVKLLHAGFVGEAARRRFEVERETLARLTLPGIARLLDGGTTDDGVPWLAMELVEGQPLDLYCNEQRLGVEARVELLAQVCDAVSHAHGQLVVHRDLKPSNVLVTSDGSPRLLDFGIAKVLDEDRDRGLTADGAAPRTPGYASPEQLRGEPVGTASDVFSLGVLLYELLTGQLPFEGEDTTSQAYERAVVERDATRASRRSDLDAAARLCGSDAPRLRRRLAGDLDNILLEALAKEPGRRYASAADLARDLRNHLAGLPVTARAPTLGYRAGKFVRRHRAASTLALLLVVTGAFAVSNLLVGLQRDRDQLRAIRQLSDARELASLRAEADGPLWPPTPDRREPLDDWLLRADTLLERRAGHAATLAQLQARVDAGEQDGELLWWHEQLQALVDDIARFAADDPWGTTLRAVRERRQLVDAIERVSLVEAADAWAAARAVLADPGRAPAYGGLDLAPQWGLVPWRQDPLSGLWEFWVVGTGEPPEVDGDGRYRAHEDGALVLVLVPGGRFWMGAQREHADQPGHDPLFAQPDESPVHEVALDPFFVAKTELTQAQWLRITGSNPSSYQPAPDGSPPEPEWPVSPLHPVELVSYATARESLRRLGLALPSEAQWEYAARAGVGAAWSFGPDPRVLDAYANGADLHARDHGGSTGWSYVAAEGLQLDDGYTLHAPVAHFAPNAFGLHDVHGNVWEWCDEAPGHYGWDVRPGDGRRVIPEGEGEDEADERALRGGAFSNPADRLRSATRWRGVREFRSRVVGVRPVRAIRG